MSNAVNELPASDAFPTLADLLDVTDPDGIVRGFSRRARCGVAAAETGDSHAIDHAVCASGDGSTEMPGEVAERRPMVRLDDVASLRHVHASAEDTLQRQIRLGRAMVREAESFGDPATGLTDPSVVFDQADTDVWQGTGEAGKGHPLAALSMPTMVDPPMPEGGVPGRAAGPNLYRQTYAIAYLAQTYRPAMTDSCGP